MSCRCGERAEQIRSAAVRLVETGDVKAVGEAAAFVVRTTAEDALDGLRKARQTAQARLGLGGRR